MGARIAILMAVYNGMEWLKPQLESIFNQKQVEVNVFISDDLSSDGSYEFLLNLSKFNSDLIVLPRSGRSGSAGSNFLRLLKDVNLNKFDYIAFSDQDDMWFYDKLEHGVDSINKNGVDGYSCNVMAFWPNGYQRLIRKSQPQQLYDFMFESAGPGCSFLLTKKLALELQNFILLNLEKCKGVGLHDWFSYAYARSHGYKWFIDHDPYVHYRQHSGNVLGVNSGFKAKLDRWGRMREGWYEDQVLLFANLLGYQDQFPILQLRRRNLISILHLILNVRKFRRGFIDALALSLFFIVSAK